MSKLSLWGAWSIAFLLVMVSTTLPFAAPVQQEPSLTPTATATVYRGPTSTPTPTLQPPPPGGGRVAVRVLVVRTGPALDWAPLGGLNYDEIIYPVGQSANGNWVAIDWKERIGWVLGRLVVWHPDLDLTQLPIILPPLTSTPLATLPTTPTELPTVSPPAPTETATIAVTDTPQPTTTPVPALTASLEPSPVLTATDTPIPAVVGPALSPTTGASPESGASPIMPSLSSMIRGLSPGIWIALGGIPLLFGLYIWYRGRRLRELQRYASGFPLAVCPVCQEGALELEEHLTPSLGIPRVRRLVRCSTCRSVLREVQPGVWRYTIDPLVNPKIAAEYNAKNFTIDELIALEKRADQYEPALGLGSEHHTLPRTQSPDEILAEIEARLWTETGDAEESAGDNSEGEPPQATSPND